MGYYTGAGVVVGGSDSISQFERYMWGGNHTVFQRSVETVTRKSGVSLKTAQEVVSAMNLSNATFWNGTLSWTSFNCKGTATDVAYSQIAGSNLYELTITNRTLSARSDNGAWQ